MSRSVENKKKGIKKKVTEKKKKFRKLAYRSSNAALVRLVLSFSFPLFLPPRHFNLLQPTLVFRFRSTDFTKYKPASFVLSSVPLFLYFIYFIFFIFSFLHSHALFSSSLSLEIVSQDLCLFTAL